MSLVRNMMGRAVYRREHSKGEIEIQSPDEMIIEVATYNHFTSQLSSIKIVSRSPLHNFDMGFGLETALSVNSVKIGYPIYT